ncbi:MAG TPA: SUMF1/EgtB/PvdO family nonheme iron enzyme [Polyangiaceae bacterium]|nr:SUMF1/EgtB/PvdO family nonheme iron enzyme [Polyangiaceae bacterium]
MMRPEPVRASVPVRASAIASAAVLGATGFLPLFGGPGYEAALAAGLVLPAAAALGTAFDVRGARRSPFDAFRRGLAVGVLVAACGFAVTVLHGFRVGFCDLLEGAELFALGPAAGAVLGGVWGAIVGHRFGGGSRRRIVLLCVLLPLLGIVASVARFYTSPMVFAFDPFFGFFAGTLYDSVITGIPRLVTYRIGSLATLVAVGAASYFLEKPSERRGAEVLAVAAAALSALHVVRGPAMGHYQLTGTIRDALGRTLEFGRCELVYAAGTPEQEAGALARECDGHVRQLENFFGVNGPPRVTAFVFANADQKGYLMGAAGTNIGKPWRREIYIQRAGYPHPVMRHELAHVLAGEFGVGPFRVAGPLHGLIPDPGRIEGVAVAAAPHDEELSLAEWSKAMKTLGLLPPLGRVFRLGFLGEPSSRAYVVAGAFVDFLRREHGIFAVRAWYGGASLERATGRSFSELERGFLASLDALAVSPEALEVARARFDQPAIFARTCPHVVDRIEAEAGGALGALDVPRARRLYRDVLALDPHDLGARIGLATCSERAGEERDATEAFEKIASDPTLGKAMRARALETLGDLALAQHRGAEAKRNYESVRSLVVDADRLRTLDVKEFAANGGGGGVIEEHLVGDLRLGRNPTLVAAHLGAWAEREPTEGLPDYLLARLAVGDVRYDLAAAALDRALSKTLSIPSVRREAYRLRVVVACALADPPSARAAFESWTSLPGSRPPEREDLTELLERCDATPPPSPTAAAAPSEAPPSVAAPVDPSPSAVSAAVSVAAPVDPSPSAVSAAPAPSTTGVSDPGPTCPSGMVPIPPADVWIGSPRGKGLDDEWPRYETKLAAFCLDRTEVTVGAYAACVTAGHCKPAGSYHVTCTAKGHGENYPINCVDWTEADVFCRDRGARLPTEAEWEYAASGGDSREYSWGNDAPDGHTCWKQAGACPVGSFPAGAFGLFDMTGNVWEWTADLYGDYPYPPEESPNRVYRGGSWSRRFEKWMRVRLRNRAAPSFEGSHLGFRCAKTLPNTECPFGVGEGGTCIHGVVTADCREGRKWNGERCAPPGAEGCGEGHHFVPGHGCQFDVHVDDPAHPPPDLTAVHRARSPEFDADCGKFQKSRPNAYRFEGGTHEARNQVERSLGCKNRDVGGGWNSACCP